MSFMWGRGVDGIVCVGISKGSIVYAFRGNILTVKHMWRTYQPKLWGENGKYGLSAGGAFEDSGATRK